jgi:hypothetical protein
MGIAAIAANAAIAKAIKASGVIVTLKPEEFSKVLNRAKDPLIVVAESGVFSTNYKYLMAYKGLTFSPSPTLRSSSPLRPKW